MIELQALRAVALHAGGKLDAALEALAHAVELGRPDGWIRVFVDAGPAMVPLLRAAASRDPHSRYLQQLVAATAVDETGSGDAPGSVDASEVELVDPLSGRELEVLRLLGSDLGGPAIARELFVSLNTVRTHTTHIYTKLGVNSRRAAVSRAHQLGLLAQASGSPRQSHHVVTPGPLVDS